MGDIGGMLDPLNIMGGGGGSSIGNVGRDFTGKPSPESQEAALNASTASTQFLTDMSKGYYNQTAGLRGALVDRFSRFMQGNLDPTASALYAPIKGSAERQYQTARNELMADTPTGGALFEGLADIQGQKAATMSDLISQIVKDEYQKAYAMGQGSQQVAASGVGAGAQSSNQLLGALAQQQSAGASGVGNAVAAVSSLLKYLAA